jgi:hypothetical protein
MIESVPIEQRTIDVGKTVVEIRPFALKPGDIVSLHKFERQQRLLFAIYQEILPELTEDNYSDLEKKHPDHMLFSFANIFQPLHFEDPDVITPRMIEAAKIFLLREIKKSPEDTHLSNALFFLNQLENLDASEELKILNVVGKGGLGVVARAIKVERPKNLDDISKPESEIDLDDTVLLKILFNIRGSHDEFNEAQQVARISSRLRKFPYRIRSSMALVRHMFEAVITKGDGQKIPTVVFEIDEAPPGIPFSKWQPQSLDEFLAVGRQMVNVIEYLHSQQIFNADSGDPFISPERLHRFLRKKDDTEPDTQDNSFIAFYDFDESVDGLTGEHPFVFNPGEGLFTGKPKDFNTILYIRDSYQPIDFKVVEFAELHIVISSILNKLIGGKGIDYIQPVSPDKGGCFFSLEDFKSKDLIQAVINLRTMEKYPLIDFQTFKEKLIFRLSDQDALAIYEKFTTFFNQYHNAMREVSKQNKVISKSDNHLTNMQEVMNILDRSNARLKKKPTLNENIDLSDQATTIFPNFIFNPEKPKLQAS